MSKKKRIAVSELNINVSEKLTDDASVSSAGNSAATKPPAQSGWSSLGKSEKLAVAGIALLLVSVVLGTTGLGRKIAGVLTSDSTSLTTAKISQSLTLNPVTSVTPQLSKEYVYAGSRLLAVEDAGANAAPPADLAVWRRGSGYWFVMGAGGSIQASQQWGNGQTDEPAAGDYDGDGKTDFCVFRASAGTWFIIKSGNNAEEYYYLGMSDDIPRAADFDGDGKTDVAVYRPSNGTWYIRQSSTGNLVSQQFGLSTDKPAQADYDGDGKADIGVWRGSDKTFYSLNSSNGQLHAATLSQAAASDVPVSGDYDGDGKADYAVKSGNIWIIRQTSNGQTQTISWQQSTDIAVQNDYDGDGKTDIAVWRDSNGDWYIRNSSSGQLRQEHWGQSGDVPVPALYRR